MRRLLAGVIDYAGLFPPAGLDMQRAAENYARYREGEQSWMLGSFVVAAARLEELRPYIPSHQQPWNLSALVGPGIDSELALVERFNGSGAGTVSWIEAKVSGASQIRLIRERIPRRTGIYFEIADAALLAAVRESGSRAKLRTGGMTRESFPASGSVAEFISSAWGREVPFKCTAGLHHALRSEYPVSGAQDSPRAMMHGFLNVLLASVFAQTAVSREELIEMLEAPSASAFGCEPDGITWQQYRVTNQQIGLARERGLVSFGSCSFTEPVAELQSLKIL
jgi:hypothetical protein